MSCIRYKFKSSLDYDTVMFNGLQLSVAELREKIMDSKKLGLGDCFTLEIMDAHTKKGAENLHVLACQSGEERRKREGRREGRVIRGGCTISYML